MDSNLTVIVCFLIIGGVLSLVAILTYVYHLRTFEKWSRVREAETTLAMQKYQANWQLPPNSSKSD